MRLRFSLIYLGLVLCMRAEEPMTLVSTGSDSLALNEAPAAEVNIPAGTFCVSEDGKCRCLVLKTTRVTAENNAIPAVAWPGVPAAGTPWKTAPETPAELAPLISRLQKDSAAVSTDTLRLTALCWLNDLPFREWSCPLSAQAKIAAALDAIVILRELAPDKTFRLQTDNELKLAALRTPGLRGKAMQAFKITIESAPVDPKSLPRMGQLMHQAPGDNCPLCRSRGDAARLQDSL